jgi:hypothetical protein
LILLGVGSVLEPPAAILILTPLLTPIVYKAGVDPIHFGIIGTVNLAIGMFMPPFGLSLFASHALFGTEIAALRGRLGGGLSGGQGKMVALGRALVAGTRYVLLDEPFQGLAPALAMSYADALVRLRRSRPDLGLLITESTPKLLDKIVDSSLTIERGEVS